MAEERPQQGDAPELATCDDCGDPAETTVHKCEGGCNSDYRLCSLDAPEPGDEYICAGCDQPEEREEESQQ